jgi:hypothetical protein
METKHLSRRRLLATTMGLGLGVGFGLSRPASAMSQSQLSSGSELGLAYANRCGGSDASAHQKLISDLQAVLMQEPGAKGQVLTKTAYCPICGCPITATRTIL